MSADFYEDLANEMANTDRYIQPDEEEEEQTMSKLIVHQFHEEDFSAHLLMDRERYPQKRKPLLTENDLVNRAVNIYQGPSHHDTMDNLRGDFRKDKYVRPLLVLRWKVLLVIGFVCFAGAVVTLVVILRDLQP
jgi:hypothetical protein